MRMIIGALGAVAILLASFFARAEGGLVLEVDGQDADVTKRAIERELASIVPAPKGELKVHRESTGSATVVYLSDDGRRIERTIELESDPNGAADEIALVAASMVRDDAGPLAPAPAPTPAVPVVGAKVSPGGSFPLPKAPAGSKAPKTAELAEPFRADPCSDPTPKFPFAVDFVPFVGTSSSPRLRASSRVFALNALGGLGAGLSGFEVGGLLNVETHHACGFELAGIANVVGGNVTGLQLGGIVDVASGHFEGAQMAGIVNVVGDGLDGAQLGVVNVVKGRVRGVQLGVVNVAEKSDFSLGVVSINTKGRTHLDLWSELEVGLVAFAVKHGGAHWHSFYGLGTRLTKPTLTFVLGVGAHVRFNKRVYLDFDALDYELVSFSNADLATHLLQARPVLGINLIDQLAVFVAPSYNVLFAPKPAVDWSPGYAFSLDKASVHMWPGATLGLQALSD